MFVCLIVHLNYKKLFNSFIHKSVMNITLIQSFKYEIILNKIQIDKLNKRKKFYFRLKWTLCLMFINVRKCAANIL